MDLIPKCSVFESKPIAHEKLEDIVLSHTGDADNFQHLPYLQRKF